MTVILESAALRMELDPCRGATIQTVTTPTVPNWLFYDPGRQLTTQRAASAYDDVWSGGFEELFPNDAPGLFDGRELPDHGELWNSSFDVAARTRRSVTLKRECTSVPAHFQKRIILHDNAAAFRVEYRITNRAAESLGFLFKLHPAMAIEPGDRILLPGGRVDAVDPSFGSRFGAGPATWPVVPSKLGGEFDLSEVPSPEARSREFVYVSRLPEGWCGLERGATGERIIFRFPLAVFPYCWLFLTYGGWRDYYTAVLEPCTNMPKDLNEAKASGRCAILDAGVTLECSVSVAIQSPNA